MMNMYYMNAFVSDVFAGNPAAVCILPAWLDDAILQSIATEQGFPAQTLKKVESVYPWDSIFHTTPIGVYEFGDERLVAVFDDESMIRNFIPHVPALRSLPHRAVVITAPSKTVDFVSRTFYPRKKDYEDPVTGSSHCLLAPYWAERLGKTYLLAHQLSSRGGALTCELKGKQVLIGGLASPAIKQ